MTFLSEDFKIFKEYKKLFSLRSVRTRRNYVKFYLFFWGFLGCGLVLVLLLPWQQTVFGEGRVIAYSPNERRQDISAPVEGLVVKWHVLEGQTVKKGMPIVDLADNDPEIISRLRIEREALKRRVDAAIAGIETAKKNVERQTSLIKKGLSATLALEQATLNLNKYLVDEANAVAELSRIDVRLSRQLTQSVVAPIDGTILKVIAGQGGQLVKGGQTLAILVPDTESRSVELVVDGNDMPLVAQGRDVRLQFEGWPAIQFSGWPSVAIGTFAARVAFIDAADDGQGKFRIIVFPVEGQPWPEARYLRQGVRVKGWVLLDTVTVGYELWRIFNDFPPSLGSPSKESVDKKLESMQSSPSTAQKDEQKPK